MRWIGSRTAGAALMLALGLGCGDDSSGAAAPSNSGAAGKEVPAAAPTPSEKPATADLVERGERVYNVNCIACHHRDPALDGGLGPPILGASVELLEARVLRGEYPPGYTPKRDTRLMVPLRHLEPDIEALAAFLEAR